MGIVATWIVEGAERTMEPVAWVPTTRCGRRPERAAERQR